MPTGECRQARGLFHTSTPACYTLVATPTPDSELSVPGEGGILMMILRFSYSLCHLYTITTINHSLVHVVTHVIVRDGVFFLRHSSFFHLPRGIHPPRTPVPYHPTCINLAHPTWGGGSRQCSLRSMPYGVVTGVLSISRMDPCFMPSFMAMAVNQ